MSEQQPLGRFVWYDLMTSDPTAAQGFYRDVVGWGTEVWPQGDPPYTMWTAEDRSIGGVMGMAPGVEGPPHWIGYVQVDDVDATCAKTTDLGGAVLKEATDIPTVGRFAMLQDPQGGVFAVFSPVEKPSEQAGGSEAGTFTWHELMTTDHAAAFDFYSDLVGWAKTDSFDMGEDGLYQMYGVGGETLGGMFNKGADIQGPPVWLYYVQVADLDGAVERVRAGGGQVLNGPMEVPGGDRIAQCMDPQGGMFALHAKGSG